MNESQLAIAERYDTERKLAVRHAKQLSELDAEGRARVQKMVAELLAAAEPKK